MILASFTLRVFIATIGPMKKSLFDEIIDRRGSGSIKWELTEKLYGSSDVLPMWVADMDFPRPGTGDPRLDRTGGAPGVRLYRGR